MPYNSAHHCVVEVENFILLLGGEDQWNPNGNITTDTTTNANSYTNTKKSIHVYIVFQCIIHILERKWPYELFLDLDSDMYFAGKHSTNHVSRYDPRFNSWIQLPPMQER
jgi:hypothetical protein